MRTREGTTTEDDKVSKMGNVANRRVLYQQFADGGEEEEASIPAPWTDADKAGIVKLTNLPIEMADTMGSSWRHRIGTPSEPSSTWMLLKGRPSCGG